LLSVSLLFVVIGFVSCDDGDGGGGGGQGGPGSGAPFPAPVPQTGQTTCWFPTDTERPFNNIPCTDAAARGEDGAVQAGVKWPSPRFTDNKNGTIRDNLTGLIWLQNANCFGERGWAQALEDANTLHDGECMLMDGSKAGDWRLPNRRELTSLVDFANEIPALPTGHPFMNFPSSGIFLYWSSTTLAPDPSQAWEVDFAFGDVTSFAGRKTRGHSVLPVRGEAAGEMAPAPVPQTGQTKCWDSAGNEIACVSTGQDGDIRAGAEWPSPRFTDNGDGTITDNLTRLIWLKNANCFSQRTWEQALTSVNTLSAGKCGIMDGSEAGDWHLPNVRELMSLLDLENSDPALPADHLLNLRPTCYWSSTTFVDFPGWAWAVNFGSGGVVECLSSKTDKFFFTAVRGELAPVPQTGQTTSYAAGDDGDIQAGVKWPNPRFTDNMNGTIRDNLTGLIWLQDANCFGGRTWAQALEDADTLHDGECGLMDGSLGGDWHLPNVLELASLFDFESINPALPPGHPFMKVQSSFLSFYWSSTTLATTTGLSAWVVGFDLGRAIAAFKTEGDGFVLAVRGEAAFGAPAPVPQTGQTTCWNSDRNKIDCARTGQDGDIRAGVEWPNLRFTEDVNGTIRDNLTGLIWLKDANCFGSRPWAQALMDANTLSAGKCMLMDGSKAGDWRLPNLRELMSLVDFENFRPALPPGHPFMNFQSSFGSFYWSSTTSALLPDAAWFVNSGSGGVTDSFGKIGNSSFVLPVRGGL
jgi:hypothetical protein